MKIGQCLTCVLSDNIVVILLIVFKKEIFEKCFQEYHQSVCQTVCMQIGPDLDHARIQKVLPEGVQLCDFFFFFFFFFDERIHITL